MAEPRDEFAGVLRELRTRARLTQEGLAAAAGLSHRTVSDLERGLAATPQRETMRLLADALSLIGPERARFETVARGRPLVAESPAAAAVALRSLPRDVASFTGRQRQLRQLADTVAGGGGVVGLHAIGGMAGVGKTAFAVHAAHRLAGQFPGGQVFLSLHGHTPGQAPVNPADALASLLLTIGVPAAQVPPDQEARAALWRDRVADRPLLLVLDDAAGSEQVQPLLPGNGESLVLVTSRRHLSALDDTTAISLDTLPPDEAAALLVRLSGRSGLRPGDPGVREITRLCGDLPLAVAMVARQLRHHPAWSAAGRAGELAAARNRLGLMETENRSVAAAFDLSYTDLTAEQQRLFRRIGLHPGPDVDGYAAAALDGISLAAARRGLEALYDQYLIMEPAQGRYQLHDLVREHARALGGRLDASEDRDAATARLLDYYQHASGVANFRIRRRARPSLAVDSGVPIAVPVLADYEQALAWARTERASLLACLDQAAAAGQHTRVISLTAGIGGLLRYDGPWADAVVRHTAAAQAAQRLDDRLGRANALIDLGETQRLTGDYPAAAQSLEDALASYQKLGDRLGQASAFFYLGTVRHMTSDYPAAVEALEQGLTLYRELGDRLGQATAYSYLGTVWRLTGDYPAAARALEQALDVGRDVGDRRAQATALTFLGEVRRQIGDYAAAAQAEREALAVYRDLGDPLGQANALAFLGSVLRLTGDYPAAAEALKDAVGLFRDIGDRGGEVEALNEQGTLYRVSGELALARNCHRQSLELSREIDSSWDEAHAMAGLGRCARAEGDTAQAQVRLRQALEIFQRIGAAEATDLQAELDAVGGSQPAQ
jgi:tetratricopeptide (TPR) repeat protein/transcriptional regulator with XRE-family HTH domain